MSFFRILLLTPLALLDGCASIVNGQNQSVSIVTPDCPGARCELSNDKGRWYLGATPGSVVISRSYADLFVRCTKADFEPAVQSIPSATKGMAFGNILFGGIIGAGVDIANGSAYDYPPEIRLPLSCESAAQKPERPAIRLGCRVKEVAEVTGGVPGFPGKSGILVSVVDSGSLAEQIGLRSGDVLTEINDTPIENARDLQEFLKSPEAREGFRIRFFRNGKSQVVEYQNKGV
ncbi:PDZ domain-containing protein [Azonexus sp.]|uniref:PDZ domain-containing protein n=1 Tax=Azonexus sp. TaxID=1872668 RepID=UPI0035B282E3